MPWDIYIEPALATTYFRRCQEFGLQQSTELVCRRRGMQLALSYNEPDYLTRNPTSQHGSGYTFTWCRPTVEPVWSRTIWDDLSETHIGCLSLVIRWSRHVWLPSNKPMFLSRTRPLGNAWSPLPAGTYGRYYSVARTSVQQVGQWNRLGICPLRYATEPSGGIWEGISLVLPRLVVPWSHSLDAKQRGSEPSADSEYEMDCLSKAQSTTCLLGTPGTISEHLSQ